MNNTHARTVIVEVTFATASQRFQGGSCPALEDTRKKLLSPGPVAQSLHVPGHLATLAASQEREREKKKATKKRDRERKREGDREREREGERGRGIERERDIKEREREGDRRREKGSRCGRLSS